MIDVAPWNIKLLCKIAGGDIVESFFSKKLQSGYFYYFRKICCFQNLTFIVRKIIVSQKTLYHCSAPNQLPNLLHSHDQRQWLGFTQDGERYHHGVAVSYICDCSLNDFREAFVGRAGKPAGSARHKPAHRYAIILSVALVGHTPAFTFIDRRQFKFISC